MASLYYQGHGSFRLTTAEGAVVYMDPYAGDGYDKPANLILVTHSHGDHNQVELPEKGEDYVILDPSDMIAPDGTYRKAYFCGCVITAVQAYNKNHPVESCVGYIIETDRKRLYFAGDTSTTDAMADMASLALDWAFLPTDGVYNMNAEEASACAKLIGAKASVPVHTKPGALFDESVAAAFVAEGKRVLLPGTETEL